MPAVIRTVVLEGVHRATMDFVQDERIDSLVSSVAATLMILIWGRFFSVAGTDHLPAG